MCWVWWPIPEVQVRRLRQDSCLNPEVGAIVLCIGCVSELSSAIIMVTSWKPRSIRLPKGRIN